MDQLKKLVSTVTKPFKSKDEVEEDKLKEVNKNIPDWMYGYKCDVCLGDIWGPQDRWHCTGILSFHKIFSTITKNVPNSTSVRLVGTKAMLILTGVTMNQTILVRLLVVSQQKQQERHYGNSTQMSSNHQKCIYGMEQPTLLRYSYQH